MERNVALSFLAIAGLIDSPRTSPQEYDDAVRRVLIEHANAALLALRPQDVIDDVAATKNLITHASRCVDCFRNTRVEPHREGCEVFS